MGAVLTRLMDSLYPPSLLASNVSPALPMLNVSALSSGMVGHVEGGDLGYGSVWFGMAKEVTSGMVRYGSAWRRR